VIKTPAKVENKAVEVINIELNQFPKEMSEKDIKKEFFKNCHVVSIE